MLTTLALVGVMTLAPAQGGLALENVRITYGELGAPRPDNSLLPGDIFFLAFDIKNITVDPTGKVQYSMSMEVTNAAGAKVFEQKPVDRNDFLPLGGNKLPARAYVTVPLDQEPGTYSCKLVVIDKANKAEQSITQKFIVKQKQFGIVSLYTSSDAKGELPAPPYGMTGQSVWVHFVVVLFDRDKTKKQPSLSVEMSTLSADGMPTVPKPTILEISSEVDEKDTGIPLRFLLPLNRPGKFTVQLKVTDKLTNKTSSVQLPIEVVPQPQ